VLILDVGGEMDDFAIERDSGWLGFPGAFGERGLILASWPYSNSVWSVGLTMSVPL